MEGIRFGVHMGVIVRQKVRICMCEDDEVVAEDPPRLNINSGGSLIRISPLPAHLFFS
jgi:hypothetical protein